MKEQRLEEIWRDNLRRYNGNVRLDSIIIKAMQDACNEIESEFNNLNIPVESNSVARCGDCEKELTLVRPGKYQCDNDNCPSNVK